MFYSSDYNDACNECVPSHLRRGLRLPTFKPTSDLSTSPFILTFLLIGLVAWRRLFPALSGQRSSKHSHTSAKFLTSPDSKRQVLDTSLASFTIKSLAQSVLNKTALITFSATIGLSAVLAELIFCEISKLIEPATRGYALETTILSLLVSLILIIPALEIHSITSATGAWTFRPQGWRIKLVLALFLDAIGFVLWLLSFWWIGRAILGASKYHDHSHDKQTVRQKLVEGSLERIGIIGISLMASLAGFAAVSSLWQTFGVKARIVTEADITRKQHGLDATVDLLSAKESRLRALERKMADAKTLTKSQDSSFLTRVMSTLSPSKSGNAANTQDYQTLQMEISGLEVMQSSLSNSLQLLRSRYNAQQRAATALGRLYLSISYLFSLYCLYRISATSLATLRRWWSPNTTFASTDPINNFLALLARAWDPSIDREAWARQISFLLSGLMLLASFNAVLQTVLLFSRFMPAGIQHSPNAATPGRQTNALALLVSQICATYVVSSALLLRSNLPKEMGHAIDGMLPLESAFVETWFEGWFLGSCTVTAIGIWMVRRITVDDDEWLADEGDLESGKRKA